MGSRGALRQLIVLRTRAILLPLAVALPRMLETIEAELADETMGVAEKWRLRSEPT